MPGESGGMTQLYKESAVHAAMVYASIKGEGMSRKVAVQNEPINVEYDVGAESKATDGKSPLGTTNERRAINFLFHTVYPVLLNCTVMSCDLCLQVKSAVVRVHVFQGS